MNDLDIEIIRNNFLKMSDNEKKIAIKEFCEVVDQAAKDIVKNADKIWEDRHKS